MQLTQEQVKSFQNIIYNNYKKNGRIFSWRKTNNPYYIFVSEVMLQQTQTSRVEKKYEQFIHRFPTFKALVQAQLYDVLEAWQGLGYNRRAKFLHQSAQIVCSQYNGDIPKETKALHALPGIGPATAASIAAFAFNAPTIFAETNIRVVFIHLFLAEQKNICDKTILSLVSQTLDAKSPRIWYYALTDYGAMLKSKGINPIKSKVFHNYTMLSKMSSKKSPRTLKKLFTN
jgi:A/G-specific adenine glycosylase